MTNFEDLVNQLDNDDATPAPTLISNAPVARSAPQRAPKRSNAKNPSTSKPQTFRELMASL